MTLEGFIALLGVATVAVSSLAYRLLYRPMRLTMDTLVEQIGNLRQMLKNAQDDIQTERASRKVEVEAARKEAEKAREETQQTRTEAEAARNEAKRISTELNTLSEKHETSESERKKNAEEIKVFKEGFERSEQRREELALAIQKQAEKHDEDLTAINDKNSEQIDRLNRVNHEQAKQLANLNLETAEVKSLYEQVQEDQKVQGRLIMELNARLENARKILSGWGLTAEQIEGLLSGALDPTVVESIVSAELIKHLTPSDVSPTPEPIPHNQPVMPEPEADGANGAKAIDPPKESP